MTREEMRAEIFDVLFALNAGIGTALEIQATSALLALIDRFEDEKWKPVTEPPEVTEQVDLLFEVVLDPHVYVDVWYGYNPGEHWPPREMYQGGRWRVLPKPPKEAPDADA